uniref:ZP domain-containing protein n=1 Tax=Panagrolaimus sp. JU765 TaxID=591449 RepID=A0AC34RIG4_9BILA
MYTGAVYAAERFSQCRVLVEDKNNFSIFINRPSINNWCNALETDNVFTVILVLSNDMVLPFDVTTKDDFFYQVTCDYHESNEGKLIHTGIVVGGPTPKSVMSSIHRDDQNEKVNFKILKNSLPVSNVFIGETLTALIQSEVNAKRIHVNECNATRVGGREPRPSSVKLISDGCSLMPQIISDMHVSENGLEASLTAFRIDGSDEIDISCSIMICRKACQQNESCSTIFERHRRTVDVNSSDLDLKFPNSEEDMVTVDQRLKVLNEEDKLNDTTASETRKKDGCLNPILLLFVAILLLLSLLALAIRLNRSGSQQCNGNYAFTFLSDRYMAAQEVIRVFYSKTLEDCLAECLNEKNFLCRSVSFNRTDGGCHLSQQNQLSKPALIKLNNNPNYRIDYYENNCYNIADSFQFDYKCQENGIKVTVKSKFPYTGALYGLYDFFTCRVEPKELTNFEYLFPYPTISRNCSDSIRFKGNDMILEVVLSTDGIEPLYYITQDDLTYQARCPIVQVTETDTQTRLEVTQASFESEAEKLAEDMLTEQERNSMKNLIKMLSAVETKTPILEHGIGSFGPLAPGHAPEIINLEGSYKTSAASNTTTTLPPVVTTTTAVFRTLKPITKDVFTLPFTKPTTSSSSPTTTQATTTTTLKSTTTAQPSTTTTSTTFSTTTTSKQTTSEELLTLGDSPVTTTFKPTVESQLNPQDTKLKKETIEDSQFRFNTRISFPTKNQITLSSSQNNSSNTKTQDWTSPTTSTSSPNPSSTTTQPSTSTTTASPTTTTTSPTSTTTSPTPPPKTLDLGQIPGNVGPPSAPLNENRPPGVNRPGLTPSGKPTQPIIFDIFHNGQPTEAVIVGSRITLSFTPYFAIPPAYMSISGCQVEPIGSPFDWEREPLAIVKDGCQADNVGLVCPPQRTDYGIRVVVESFRYQSTMQVQYTCLVRVCPFSPCPTSTCNSVDGCPKDDLLSRAFGLRAKRDLSFDQIRAALVANPRLQQQLVTSPQHDPKRMTNTLSSQLLMLSGDHLVKKKLVVVNNEDELAYYVRTGAVPDHL